MNPKTTSYDFFTNLVCRALLPGAAIFLLIVIPELVIQPTRNSFNLFDWIVRIFITLWFCSAYWSLPTAVTASGEIPLKDLWLRLLNWSEPTFKILFFFNTTGFSIGAAILMLWALSVYLPAAGNVRYFIAACAGAVFSIVLLPNYHIYRSKIGSERYK